MAKGPLNLITVITVNILGLHTVLPVSHPQSGEPVARGLLTPSPITDTDMVLDTTDTDTWVSLDTPDMLPLLLPGRILEITYKFYKTIKNGPPKSKTLKYSILSIRIVF